MQPSAETLEKISSDAREVWERDPAAEVETDELQEELMRSGMQPRMRDSICNKMEESLRERAQELEEPTEEADA